MWAYVKDNKIEEIIAIPKSIVIDNVRHPKEIFSSWSWSELNAIGIYIVEAGSQGDSRFEITSQPKYSFDSSNKKVTTSYTKTDRELNDTNAKNEDGSDMKDPITGEQIINIGLKTVAKQKAKQEAHGLINRFNWLVERSVYESSKAIPDAVKTYVAAIRKDCSDIETAIDNASNMTAFKSLYADFI